MKVIEYRVIEGIENINKMLSNEDFEMFGSPMTVHNSINQVFIRREKLELLVPVKVESKSSADVKPKKVVK